MPPGGGKRKRGHGGGDHYHQSSPGHERRPPPPRDQDGGTPNNRRNQNSNRGGRGGGGFGDRGGGHGRPQQSRPGSSHSNAQSPRSNHPPAHQFQPPPTPTPAAPPRMTPSTPVSTIPIAPPTPQVPEINASAGSQRMWEHITPARLESWSASGQSEIVAELVTQSASGNYIDAMVVVQEILWAGIDGRISPILAANVFIDAIKVNRENIANEAASLKVTDLILDTVPLYDQHQNLTAIIAPLIPDYLSRGEARLHLQDTLLQALGLVSNGFKSRQIKVQTNMLYRVQKYNLSREESEGYSKLITEVFMAEYSGGPLERVSETLDNVRSLIGCFDLDPNRVLDIILDVFANGVVANYRFFIELLRQSEWWPKDTPPLDDNPIYRDEDFFDRLERDGFKALVEDKDGVDILTRRGGNKVAAQLIGFKFKFYTMNGLDLDSASNQLPDNLVAMTAILIKIGFISFMDLYPHLGPEDQEMEDNFNEWRKENDSKGRSGAINALMMASVLPDDTVPPPRPGQQPVPAAEAAKKPEEETKPEEPPAPAQKPKNQKLALLNAILAAGALPEALFMFGKYPKIAYPHPEVAENLHRLLHYCIDDVYKRLEPAQGSEVGAKKVISTDPALKAAAAPRQPLVPAPPVKITKYLLPFYPAKEGDPNREYRYFWEPEWTANLPLCKTERDVRVLCLPVIKGFSGTRLANDVKLISKLVRIGIAAVKENGTESQVGKGWVDITRYLLLPALSLSGSNSSIGSEIFNLMELYSLEVRFGLYGFWVNTAPRLFPEVKSKAAETTKNTKNILKRLSTTNVREMARKMSKISYSNPVTAFTVIIGQIESYDNLIECVVDSARHFSKMGFDAFTYSILVKISEDKGRMQQDGLLVSKWLQALATFCGRLYKRYPELDPHPILLYIVKKLQQENSADLIVLQEMIKSMAGIVGESNLSDVQIMGLYGSENLRAKILAQLGDKRYSSRDSAKRLASALVDHNIAGQLLVLLGQERKMCMYRKDIENAPIKVVGNMYDEINSVINMYMDMLNYTLDFDQWSKAIPSVDDFVLKYGVEPQIAWFYCRAHVRELLKREGMLFPDDDKKAIAANSQSSQSFKKEASQDTKQKPEKNVDTDGEVVMTDATAEAGNAPKDEDVAMADGPNPSVEETKNLPFSPIMLDLMERLRPSMPEDVWTKISLSFYTTFWQLSIYELHCPITPYDEEIKLLNNELVRVIPDKNMSTHSRKRESDRLRNQADRLSQDMKLQIRLQMSTVKRINRESQHWFAADQFTATKLPIQILQYCLLPRLVLSPHDASFCAKFIKRMHVSGTQKFWTFFLYDTIFERHILEATIFMSTEREVENYGRFLAEIMADFTTWHKNKASFEKECHGKGNLPGFAKTWGGALLDYEDFRRVLYKWHKQLHAALKACLNHSEYMHVRNATIVLKHLNKSFPTVDWIGKNLMERVQQISKTEKREDLKITTTALLSLLKKKEKEWMPVQQFQMSVADANAKSPANLPTSKSGTPAPPPHDAASSSGPGLNPAVTPFKPNNSSNSPLSQQITVHTKSSKEVEDGEIDDLPSAKGDGKLDIASSIAGLTPLPSKAVKDISGRSPTPQPRSQTPNRDSRGRSDSRAPPPRNDLNPNSSQEQRRGNSPRAPLELFPSKDRDTRDSRRDESSRPSGQSKHEDRRERSDSRADSRNVLPQPPSSLPAKPNTPMPPIPRPGGHRADSDSRGRQGQETREPRGQESRRHPSPRRESRGTPRDQLPDLIDELNANKLQQQQRGGGRGSQRPGSDYRSRSPDASRKRQDNMQDQRVDNHSDYPRPPAGPRGDVDRGRQSHGRDSFGGNRPPPAGPSDHGRLNQDPNHGRLNQPEQTNIPSGPRAGGRPSGPGGGQNSGFPANTNVPNGPRTGRTSLTLNNRSQGGNAPSQVPTAPQGSNAIPIHPDRARAFGGEKPNSPAPINTNASPAQNTHARSSSGASPTTNVHPSRLAVLGQVTGDPVAPSGPRSELPSPTGPSNNRGQGQSGGGGRDSRRDSLDHHHDRRRARGLQDILSGGSGAPSPGGNAPSEPGQGRRRGRGNTQGGQQPGGPAPNNTPGGNQQGPAPAGGSDDGRRRDRDRDRENRDGRERRDREGDREHNREREPRDRERERDRDNRDQRKGNERNGGPGQPGGQSNRSDNRPDNRSDNRGGGGERDRDRERDMRDRDRERDTRERDRDRDRGERDREGGRENRGGDRDNREHGGRENRDRDRERGDRPPRDREGRGGDREWDERARRDNQNGGGNNQGGGGGGNQSRQGGGGGGGGGAGGGGGGGPQNQNQGPPNQGSPGQNQHGQKRPHRDEERAHGDSSSDQNAEIRRRIAILEHEKINEARAARRSKTNPIFPDPPSMVPPFQQLSSSSPETQKPRKSKKRKREDRDYDAQSSVVNSRAVQETESSSRAAAKKTRRQPPPQKTLKPQKPRKGGRISGSNPSTRRPPKKTKYQEY
ncbi:hypothetical protein H072_3634 [Dactylellina haptotyla CBS 200.50]|uniref:THO complex subunit 2 n=1 Tax=Dactylellina haptotyla (strain CBS 200.50) TaxID=1284197 RepID=S8BSN6_DACHA|nr:hypothetical protein H072_3634 [Dactylellina haptotyla CBS 200.50]